MLIPPSYYNNSISREYITIKVPAVSAAIIAQFKILYEDVIYKNETVVFYYKSYSSMSSIYPIYGPS